MSSLRSVTSLCGGGVEVAPVDSQLQSEVEEDEAHEENLERGPGGGGDQGELTEPLLRNLELLVHVLSKLEIEQSHLVACEVRGKLDGDGAPAVQNLPLWVVVLLGAETTYCLHEVLGLGW